MRLQGKMIFLLSILALSCSEKHMKLEDIPGVYEASKKELSATLVIRSDKTFLQILHQQSRVDSVNGIWKADSSSGEIEVVLIGGYFERDGHFEHFDEGNLLIGNDALYDGDIDSPFSYVKDASALNGQKK